MPAVGSLRSSTADSSRVSASVTVAQAAGARLSTEAVGDLRFIPASPFCITSSTAHKSPAAPVGRRSALSARASRPSPPVSAPHAKGISLPRQGPRAKVRLSDISSTTAAEPKGTGGGRQSSRPAVAATRSGIPTSLSLSRQASIATRSFNRPASDRDNASSASQRVGKKEHVANAATSLASAGLSLGRGKASQTSIDGSSLLETSSAGPLASPPGSRMAACPSGVAGCADTGNSRADSRDRARTTSGRSALAETSVNGFALDASKTRRMTLPKSSSPSSAATPGSSIQKRTISMLAAATSAPQLLPSAAAARTHRRSPSSTQTPSPSLSRTSPQLLTAVVPRPLSRPEPVILSRLPIVDGAAPVNPPAAVPVSAVLLSSEPEARSVNSHPSPDRIDVRNATVVEPTIAAAVTPDRSAAGSGLPLRSALSYPSPQPLQLDALSPPMMKRPLPKTAVGRLSTSARLAPRSSLVSFEAMSRTVLPPEDSLLIDDAGATQFGVLALSSPPPSISALSSRQRREATNSSTDSELELSRDPFASTLHGSSFDQSFIPLPIPSTPHTPEVSNAALRSRLQQNLLTQAALQRQLEDCRTLGQREEELREETTALGGLLQSLQDDLAKSEAELRVLRGSVASLTASTEAATQQMAALSVVVASTGALATGMLSIGERAMVDEWEAVVRRAKEELAACQGEREMLDLIRSTTTMA